MYDRACLRVGQKRCSRVCAVSSPPTDRKRFYKKVVVYEHQQHDCGGWVHVYVCSVYVCIHCDHAWYEEVRTGVSGPLCLSLKPL